MMMMMITILPIVTLVRGGKMTRGKEYDDDDDNDCNYDNDYDDGLEEVVR